jgi:hypothetical protein
LLKARFLPCPLAAHGRLDGLLALRGCGLGVLAQHVARVRGADVGQAFVTADPLAVDIVVEPVCCHLLMPARKPADMVLQFYLRNKLICTIY